MKVCPKCATTHQKNGIFCSRKCANSRTWTEEQNSRRSASVSKTLSKIDPVIRKRNSAVATRKAKEASMYRIVNTPTSELSHGLIRKKLILEQKNSCLHCGLDEWLGNPIKLELDHINGNNKDNSRENLRMLCPNCHSMTPTWKTGDKPHWKHRIKKDVTLL